MKKLFLILFVTFFSLTSANAMEYFVEFDQTGSGLDANLVEMDVWSFAVYNEFNPDAGEVGDIFTYQEADGSFVEDFTFRVDEGLNTTLEGNDGIFAFDDMFVDIHLEGTYFSDAQIEFDAGNVQVYKDNDANGDFTPGDIDVATLDFDYALTTNLSGALFGDQDLSMDMDIGFDFSTVNSDFWGADEEFYTDKGWLLSLVSGRIFQEYILEDPTDVDLADPYIFLIEWTTSDFIAEFRAVPEPSTFILLGAGLAGLVFFSRKKRS